VLGPIASKLTPASRAGARFGLAATVLLFGCQSLQNAVANGDTRTITMRHLHTKEDITITFKRDGRYDADALKKLNWFLRDWRENKETRMDPHLIDLVWEINREVGGTQPIQIICGYRDEHTNSMLRRRSNGVAQNSLHMSGQAMDFAIPGVPLAKLRVAGLRLQRGGVGFYPTSGSPFVHMDVGGVRHWPRMTREQLVRVFPDGRTVHIPTDGKPLAGYALALADIERQGGSPSQMSLAAAQNSGIDTEAVADAAESGTQPRRSLLAALFSGTGEDAAETEAAKPAKTPAPVRVARAAPALPAGPVPLPKTRPEAAPVVVAMALPEPRPAPAEPKAQEASASAKHKPDPKPEATTVASAAPTPNEIIRTRGYWVGLPDTTAPATPTVQLASYTPNSEATGSVPREWLPSSRPRGSDQRLAYAAMPEQYAAPARKSWRTVIMRSAEAATSVAVKAAPKPAVPPPRPSNPWLVAVTITPSVWTYLSSTQYGVRDFRSLRPYLDKPVALVAMAFSDNPHGGLSAMHFSGSAVVFPHTVTFAAKSDDGLSRTAALR